MATKSKTSSTPVTSIEDVTEQMAILRDDMSALTATIADLMKERSDELTDKAKATIDTAKKTARDGADEAMQQAVDARAYVDDVVARNPGGALAIAAGIGFFVGMLSARR